jgi:DNA-binding XRE family transcriptional regulator
MSTYSELKARLGPRAPVRAPDPPPSFSGELVPIVLRREGVLDKPVTIAQRLRAAGLTLRAAHAVVTRLAEAGLAVCSIAEGADIPGLARDLLGLHVRAFRQRVLDPGLIARVRARHGLSQREFAEILGIEPDTLKNWEQGRNKPDAAALTLVMAFDENPDVIERASLEPAC